MKIKGISVLFIVLFAACASMPLGPQIKAIQADTEEDIQDGRKEDLEEARNADNPLVVLYNRYNELLSLEDPTADDAAEMWAIVEYIQDIRLKVLERRMAEIENRMIAFEVTMRSYMERNCSCD